VPLVRPVWLTALPRGEAFVRMKGEVWKLRMPRLAPVPPETLDTLGLTALWTALDPETVAAPRAGAVEDTGGTEQHEAGEVSEGWAAEDAISSEERNEE
jgi:hypothetical protein